MNDKAFSNYCIKILKDSTVCFETLIFHDLIFKDEYKELIMLFNKHMDEFSPRELGEVFESLISRKELEVAQKFLKEIVKEASKDSICAG